MLSIDKITNPDLSVVALLETLLDLSIKGKIDGVILLAKMDDSGITAARAGEAYDNPEAFQTALNKLQIENLYFPEKLSIIKTETN